MSSRPPRGLRSRLARRVVRRMGWLVGAPLAIFRFLSREMPVEEVDPAVAPPPLPAEHPDPAHSDDEQAVGPVAHRLYSATIRAPKLTADRLLAIIAADPNVIAPSEVLRFEKLCGEPGGLHEGDVVLIRMAGPWNGPVKVTRRWEEGFRLAATRGHPQVGQVQLRARNQDDEIAMEIQTRERAAGLGFHLLQRTGLIRRMQTYTWAEMLENAAQLAGGRRPERITVRSWRGGSAQGFGSGTGVGDNGHRDLAGLRRLAIDAAGYAAGLALAGLAGIRRGKAVHPHGAVYEAELVVPGYRDAVGHTELFGTPGRRPALVRFSRSLGLPRPLPDLLGMSVRVLDAYGKGRHQDFLLVSSVDAPVVHHMFVPASDIQQRPYSSSLPYRAGDRTLIVGALPCPGSPRFEGGTELERLAAAAATGRLVFDLAVAKLLGRFRPVGELQVGKPLPPETDALRFNPWNTGGGLEPIGVLNRLRDYAYPLSQRTWGRLGLADRQAAADRAIERRRAA